MTVCSPRPPVTTGNGVAGGSCMPGMPNGTTTEYEEGIDLNQTTAQRRCARRRA